MMNTDSDIVTAILEDSIRVKRAAVESNREKIRQVAGLLGECLSSGCKVMIFGNGGSAADSQHIAAEFVNRFLIERPPLAALALTTDSSVLSSIGNDYHFDEVFAKQLRALGRQGDIAWGLSTSGNSPNVVKALECARDQGLKTVGMTGRGGRLAALADIVLTVDSDVTARIQETHITIGHIICELVERLLFPDGFSHE
jgi:D-sedoheptulose 7-phosphate isomerase